MTTSLTSRLRAGLAAAGLLLGALTSSQTLAQARIGHVEAAGQPLDIALHEAVELISKRTDGRVNFTIFPSSQIGDARAMTESVQLGMQEAVVVPAAFIGGFNPLISILDIPYLLPTSDGQADEMRHSEFGEALLASFDSHGLVALSLWPGGFKHFTSNNSLDSIEDFEGQRFRIMDSRVLRAQFEAVGAQAMPIPFGDVYTALQTGVVDGQENPLDSIARMNFDEVQEYILLSSHGVVENVVLVSPAFFNGLSKEDQTVMRETFVELMPELGASKATNQEQALEEIRAAGLTIREFSDAEQQQLRETMYPAARDAFLSQAGADGEALIELYERVYQDIID